MSLIIGKNVSKQHYFSSYDNYNWLSESVYGKKTVFFIKKKKQRFCIKYNTHTILNIIELYLIIAESKFWTTLIIQKSVTEKKYGKNTIL